MPNDLPAVDRRPFPVLDERATIPWGVIASHAAQAKRNHYQTLERLAERGGLGWSELIAVLENREWRWDDHAKAKVLALVEKWNAQQADKVEAVALVLWHRFGPLRSFYETNEEHRAEYRLAAQEALKAAANVS